MKSGVYLAEKKNTVFGTLILRPRLVLEGVLKSVFFIIFSSLLTLFDTPFETPEH